MFYLTPVLLSKWSENTDCRVIHHFRIEQKQPCIQATPAVHAQSHLHFIISVPYSFQGEINHKITFVLLTLQLFDEGPCHSGTLGVKNHMTLRENRYIFILLSLS